MKQGSLTRILQKEFFNFTKANTKALGFSAFPSKTLLKWVAIVQGVKGTCYSGLTYKISIHFPDDYPNAPPKVKFVTPCYHPNISVDGTICLDILSHGWSPSMNLSSVLLSIRALLGEEMNSGDPLNVEAAADWEKIKKTEGDVALMKDYLDTVRAWHDRFEPNKPF